MFYKLSIIYLIYILLEHISTLTLLSNHLTPFTTFAHQHIYSNLAAMNSGDTPVTIKIIAGGIAGVSETLITVSISNPL